MSYPCARLGVPAVGPVIDWSVDKDTPFPAACPPPGPEFIDLTDADTATVAVVVPDQNHRPSHDLRGRDHVGELIVDHTPTESIPQVAAATTRS